PVSQNAKLPAVLLRLFSRASPGTVRTVLGYPSAPSPFLSRYQRPSSALTVVQPALGFGKSQQDFPHTGHLREKHRSLSLERLPTCASSCQKSHQSNNFRRRGPAHRCLPRCPAVCGL